MAHHVHAQYGTQQERDAFARRTRIRREHTGTILEARDLIRSAMSQIDDGELGKAAWRLADALGLIGDVSPDAPGINRLTGRGYGLKTKKDAQ